MHDGGFVCAIIWRNIDGVLKGEIKKLLCNKIIWLLYFLSAMIIVFSTEYKIRINENESISSIANQASYNQYRDGINEQILYYLSVSEESSYEWKNVQAVSRKYAELGDVTIYEGDSSIERDFFSFSIVDVVCLLQLFFLSVLIFIDEREKGIWSFLKTTYRGQKDIIFSKLLCLLLGSVITIIGCYSLNIIVLFSMDILNNVNHSIQSVNGFIASVLPYSIGKTMLIFIIIKGIILVAISGIMAYMCMKLKSVLKTFVGVLGICIGEFALWKCIGINDRFALFHEINIIALLDTRHYIAEYYNIPFGHYPVSQWICGMLMVSFLIVISMCGIITEYRNEIDTYNIKFRACGCHKQKSKKKKGKHGRSLFQMELLKIVKVEKAWILCVAFVIMAIVIYQKDDYEITSGEYYYRAYATQVEGKATEEKINQLYLTREHIMQDNHYDKMLGEKMTAIDRVIEEVQQAQKDEQSFVYQTPWQYYLGGQARRYDRLIILLIILYIVILSSGAGAIEQDSCMKMMFATFSTTEKRIVSYKILAEMILVTIAYGMVVVPHIYKIKKVYGIGGGKYPVSSLQQCVKGVFNYISLNQMLVMKYMLIYGMSILTTALAVILSYKIKNRIGSIAIELLLLGITIIVVERFCFL